MGRALAISPSWMRLLTLLTVFGLMASQGSWARPKTHAKSRKPMSVNSMGIPLLPDGSPDYSKIPNPFVVKKWSFDLNGAMGQRKDTSYQEFGLGFDAYFYRWMAWRNQFFVHTGQEKNFGLDMSERLSYEIGRSGFHVFGSPGFRFAGGGEAAPFLEAGVSIKLGDLKFSAGGRQLLGSWVRTGRPNENQVFISLGTGGPR